MTDASYTRDQLMQGLRAAHDAGDTDAATAIAKRVQQLDAGGAPPASSPAAGSASAAASPSQPSFTSTMLSRLGQQFQGANQAANDYTRVFSNALSMGQADKFAAAVAGTDLATERANTAASRERLGAMAPITEGAGYMMGPGKMLGPASKAIAGAAGYAPGIASWAGGVIPSTIEGTAAGGLQAAGEGKDPTTGMTVGAASGIAGVPLGTAGNAFTRAIGNLTGLRKSISDMGDNLGNASSQMWDQLKGVRYSPKDIQATSRAVQSDATAGGQPMTEVGNPKAYKLLNKFSDYSADPTSTHSLPDLIGWQKQADKLTGDDAPFGQALKNRIENTIQTATPTKSSIPAASVPDAVNQARGADALVDQYNQNLTNPPPTALGSLADTIGSHSWSLAHHGAQPMVAPMAEALGLGGLAYEQTGHWMPAVGATAATLAGQPLLNWGARGLSNWQRGVSSDAANRALLGIDNPNYRDAFRQLIIGGTPDQVQ